MVRLVVVGITTVITSYYLVITGWTLGYAADSVRDDVRVFAEFTNGYASVYFFIAVVVLAGLLLLRGVTAIERLSKVLMPLLLVLIIGLVISTGCISAPVGRSASLPGSSVPGSSAGW